MHLACQESGPAELPDVAISQVDANARRSEALQGAAVAQTSEARFHTLNSQERTTMIFLKC